MSQTDDILVTINKVLYFPEDLSKYHHIFDLLPVSLYWKNTDGKYLGRNRFAAEQMVFQEFEQKLDVSSVYLKSDYDFVDKETADQFREHDRAVLSDPEKIFHFVEEVTLPSGDLIENVSVKRPLLDKNKEPTGIFGCTININKFIQPEKSLEQIVKDNAVSKLRKLIMQFMGSDTPQLLSDIRELLFYLIPFYRNEKEFKKLLLLTPRESECLCLLLKGYSAKHIAVSLRISHRTVEIHVGRIKEKLSLPFKSEIIDWFWSVLSRL